MSIALVVTRGFGNGTLVGTIPFAVTAGYSIAEDLGPWTVQPPLSSTWADQADAAGVWTPQTDDTATWS